MIGNILRRLRSMPSFSTKSKANLYTAHVDLQRLFEEVVKGYDCTVIVGFRAKDAQDDGANQECCHGFNRISPSLSCLAFSL